MGKPNFREDFKRDAVHQISVRGYPVREVSERLGVSIYSLYKWMKVYAKAASKASSVEHEAENRRLTREPARMTEERDILKKRPHTSQGMQGKVRVRAGASPVVFGACDVSLPQHSSQWVLHGLRIP
ncbi:hypothetical protein NBRC116601_18020 [Cognatishimia sp. WU-CL00825]